MTEDGNESGRGKANHESLWVRTYVRARIRTHVRCNVETGACPRNRSEKTMLGTMLDVETHVGTYVETHVGTHVGNDVTNRSMPTEPFRTIPGDQCHHRPFLAFLFSLQEAFSRPCGETGVAVAYVAFDEAGWLSNFMQQPKLQARSS